MLKDIFLKGIVYPKNVNAFMYSPSIHLTFFAPWNTKNVKNLQASLLHSMKVKARRSPQALKRTSSSSLKVVHIDHTP